MGQAITGLSWAPHGPNSRRNVLLGVDFTRPTGQPKRLCSFGKHPAHHSSRVSIAHTPCPTHSWGNLQGLNHRDNLIWLQFKVYIVYDYEMPKSAGCCHRR